MIKTITKVGNSHAIIFDRALLDLARLKPGDKVNLTVRDERTIVIEPLRESVRARKTNRSPLTPGKVSCSTLPPGT